MLSNMPLQNYNPISWFVFCYAGYPGDAFLVGNIVACRWDSWFLLSWLLEMKIVRRSGFITFVGIQQICNTASEKSLQQSHDRSRHWNDCFRNLAEVPDRNYVLSMPSDTLTTVSVMSHACCCTHESQTNKPFCSLHKKHHSLDPTLLPVAHPVASRRVLNLYWSQIPQEISNSPRSISTCDNEVRFTLRNIEIILPNGEGSNSPIFIPKLVELLLVPMPLLFTQC